ncbi:hypothetical protein CLV62_14619 [Dysgonomonas alginatilytica]|uniref:Uncharacterized protein n=1 Tax=Dysgonomonas alginatilytica TaxID=1605892 RepID=A0A2V3PHM3_9BACT|nr:hypothetical protein [Dysgonomonas alginatilytica]PXV58468.1 hypothetical protein CLV62_14619 [Dysgonomonas alginatilytica]
MKKKKAVLATSYTSHIFKNDVTFKSPDSSILCSGGCLMVATESKNKETTASLFFFRRQRSKVIARVTQKSLRGFLSSLRAYLALAGGFKICSRWSHILRSLGSLRISLPTVAKDPGCVRRLHFISRWSITLRPAQMQMGI